MAMDAGLNDTGHSAKRWAIGGQDPSAPEGVACCGVAARDGATPGKPERRKLADDWITLWQSELSAMAVDREIQESWRTILGLWAGTVSTVLRGLARHLDTTRHDGSSGRAPVHAAPRTTPADAAPDTRNVEIERLANQVTELERRLADLERGGNSAVPGKGRPRRKQKK